jgi:hypothetical protein
VIFRWFGWPVEHPGVCLGDHHFFRSVGDLSVLQRHTFADHVQGAIESFFHNHFLAALLLDLVKLAIEGDGVVVSDGPFRFVILYWSQRRRPMHFYSTFVPIRRRHDSGEKGDVTENLTTTKCERYPFRIV